MRSGLAVVFSMIAAPAWAQPVAQGPGYCGPMWGNWGGMMTGPFSMILLLVLLVLVIVFGARWFSQAAPSSTSALDILNARYARGEIDKAEYDQKKRDLS